MQEYELNQALQRTLPRARVALTRPRGCPEIALWLFDPQCLNGPLSHHEAQAVVGEPAYWSFCWASGQVLAQWILDHPEVVEGRRVLDFGAGSGVVAIAAAMAGAKEVIAADLDPDALIAARVNASENGVRLATALDAAACSGIDLLLAADVLYDPENLPMLERFRGMADRVLMADSRLKTLGNEHYRRLEAREARTWPDLHEFEEFNRVRIYAAQ